MPDQHKIISIIPARGGSKRIPGKNLRLLGKHPLTAHSILHSRHSRHIDRCIVSTDDPAIADLAQAYGAEVQMRQAELATDTAGTIPVCQQVVSNLEAEGYHPDFIVLLQPTSPFRRTENTDACIEKLISTGADMVLSVKRVKAGPEWLMHIEADKLDFVSGNDFTHIRSQEQPAYFRPGGSLYIYTRDTLMNAPRFPWGQHVIPQVLEAPYDLDIDVEIDFRIAEALAHEYLQDW